MGGFGTYALRSDSQGVGSGTVQSGTRDIVSVGAASWADLNRARNLVFTFELADTVTGTAQQNQSLSRASLTLSITQHRP